MIVMAIRISMSLRHHFSQAVIGTDVKMVGNLVGRELMTIAFIEDFYRHRLRQEIKRKAPARELFFVNACRRRASHLRGSRVGFEGLGVLAQPSPNRPSAVRDAHSTARRGRASFSRFCSQSKLSHAQSSRKARRCLANC